MPAKRIDSTFAGWFYDEILRRRRYHSLLRMTIKPIVLAVELLWRAEFVKRIDSTFAGWFYDEILRFAQNDK